jgi:hypothetical protein
MMGVAMDLRKIVTPAVVLAAITLTGAPALAQHRGHGGGGGGGARGGGGGAHAVPRGSAGSRVVVGGSRFVGVAPYRFYRPYYAFRPRVSLGFGFWAGYPVAYPYYGYYGGYYGYPYAYPAPYGYAPYGYPPAYGYPSPYGYSTPYGYPPPAYPQSGYSSGGYPPPDYPQSGYSTYPQSGYPQSGYPTQPAPGSVGVQPGNTSSSGVSFEISPATAAVYVDGTYMGTVQDFGPTSQPLSLAPGRHRIEIRAQGYQNMAFDAEVPAGQVIPYQGTMVPAR